MSSLYRALSMYHLIHNSVFRRRAQVAQGHTASKWKSWGSKPQPNSKACVLNRDAWFALWEGGGAGLRLPPSVTELRKAFKGSDQRSSGRIW